jgi:hypothetical protein
MPGAVTELTRVVLAPARQPTGPTHGAGVVSAGRDRGYPPEPEHPNRSRTRSPGAIPQRPPAPAPHTAAVHECARVVGTRRDRRHAGRQPDDLDRLGRPSFREPSTVTELAAQVVTPALDAAGPRERARMVGPRRHREDAGPQPWDLDEPFAGRAHDRGSLGDYARQTAGIDPMGTTPGVTSRGDLRAPRCNENREGERKTSNPPRGWTRIVDPPSSGRIPPDPIVIDARAVGQSRPALRADDRSDRGPGPGPGCSRLAIGATRPRPGRSPRSPGTATLPPRSRSGRPRVPARSTSATTMGSAPGCPA